MGCLSAITGRLAHAGKKGGAGQEAVPCNVHVKNWGGGGGYVVFWPRWEGMVAHDRPQVSLPRVACLSAIIEGLAHAGKKGWPCLSAITGGAGPWTTRRTTGRCGKARKLKFAAG